MAWRVCGDGFRRGDLGRGRRLRDEDVLRTFGDYEMNNHVVDTSKTGGSAGSPKPGAGIPTPPRAVRSRPLGTPVELPAHPRWPGCDDRDRNLPRSRAPEEERAGMDNGNVWSEAMAETRERLDALAPGKETSPVRRRLGWPGIAVMGRRVARRRCRRVPLDRWVVFSREFLGIGGRQPDAGQPARRRRKPEFSIFVASCALNSVGLLEFDAVFGGPGQRIHGAGR